MGTTAWTYDKGTWTDASDSWTSNDEWGWREELRSNGYEPDPSVRLGDLDADNLAVEVFAKSADAGGWAVVITVGETGEVVKVETMPGLLALLSEIGPVVEQVANLTGGATSTTEREYARLRKLGYPHEVADEASRTFAAETANNDDD